MRRRSRPGARRRRASYDAFEEAIVGRISDRVAVVEYRDRTPEHDRTIRQPVRNTDGSYESLCILEDTAVTNDGVVSYEERATGLEPATFSLEG